MLLTTLAENHKDPELQDTMTIDPKKCIKSMGPCQLDGMDPKRLSTINTEMNIKVKCQAQRQRWSST